MSNLRIIDFKPEHQPLFESLNRAWIEKYFEMEERDIAALTRPGETIIDRGGAILVAEYDGVVAGVVGLKKSGPGEFELTKMAVDENFRRKGIAIALCRASFLKAKELGAKKIILYSSSILTAAISMYEKLGFRHEPVGKTEYKRSDVKMEMSMEAALESAGNIF